MRITRIRLYNFRNLHRLELEPAPGYNIIYGPNAAGKTNLCEAIYHAACGGLLKGERQRDLINWGADQALIELELEADRIRVILERRAQARRVELNGKRVSLKEIQQRLRVVSFTPDDLRLITGRPRERRRFLDTALAELDWEYSHLRQRYDQVVRWKNALLKRERCDEDLLQVYDQELLDLGAALIVRRLDYLRLLNATLAALGERLGLDGLGLALDYHGLRGLAEVEPHQEKVRELLKAELARWAAMERRRGYALVGPHRDDLRFHQHQRSAGGGEAIDLGRFGSQGERRSALILIKLAQLELHRARYGDYPVLILDDLLSELDPARAELLIAALPKDVQVFLTYTELTERLRRLLGRAFHIAAGQLTSQEARA